MYATSDRNLSMIDHQEDDNTSASISMLTSTSMSMSISSPSSFHDYSRDGTCIIDNMDALISDSDDDDSNDDDLSSGTDGAVEIKIQNGEESSDDDDEDESDDNIYNDKEDESNYKNKRYNESYNVNDNHEMNNEGDNGEEKVEEASEKVEEEALKISTTKATRATTLAKPKPKLKPRNVPDSRVYKWVTSKEWKQAEDFLLDDDITKQEKQKALLYRDESESGLGNTPLVRAILKQSAPMSLLKLMVKIGGTDLIQMVNDSNWSVLHWMAFSNHVSLDVFQLVVQKVNNIELFQAKNNYNQTPLDILLSRGRGRGRGRRTDTGVINTSTPAPAAMDKIEVVIAKQQRLLKYQQDLVMSSTLSEATATTTTKGGADAAVDTDADTKTPPLPSSASTMILSSTSQSQKKAVLKKATTFYSSCIKNVISWSRNLSEAEQSLVLKHPYFKSMLNHVFISPQYLFVAMMDFYLQFAIVLVFSFFLRNAIDIAATSTSASTEAAAASKAYVVTSLIILICGFIWFFIRKTTQLMSSLLKTFFLDPVNVLDIIQFVLLIGSIVLIIGIGGGGVDDGSVGDGDGDEDNRNLNILSTMDRLVLTSACCVTWLKLIFVIGNLYYLVGVFASAFITIIGKVIPFLFISTMLTFMLSHMYLMWSVGQTEMCADALYESVSIGTNDNWTCHVSSSYVETFAMLFSLDSQSSPHGGNSSSSDDSPNAISFLHGFIISILMLNILIAIVSYYFQMSIEKGEHTFWRNRLQFVIDCQSFFSLFAFWEVCHGNCCREIDQEHDDEYSKVQVVDDNDDDNDNDSGDDLHQSTFNNGGDHDGVSHFDRGGGGDVDSIYTTKSRSEFVPPVNRITFGKMVQLDVYRRRLAKSDKKIFFRWWFNKSNHPASTPPLKTRLKYFFHRASIDEIIFPGKEFENILMGIRYNEKGRGMKLFFARLASYLLSAVNIFLVIMALVLGSVTFGLLWPTMMKENLFYVDTKRKNATDRHKVEVEELRVQIMNRVEEYEQNQEKKLERLMKSREEREKKRLAKMFHKMKDFSKEQKEHEIRFDKIDEDLNDIKRVIVAIGTRLKI